MNELCEGMRVFCFIPEGIDVEDEDDFNAGWDGDMYECIDHWGRIDAIGAVHSNGRRTLLIVFDNNERWWWDELFVSPAGAPDCSTIEESEFNDILDILG